MFKDGTKEYERIMMLREISQVEARMECAHEILHQAWKNISIYRMGCGQPHIITKDLETKLNQMDGLLCALCREYLDVIQDAKQRFIDELNAKGLNVGASEIMDTQATGFVECFAESAALKLKEAIDRQKDD